MARVRQDQHLLPSVLDRLLDDRPDLKQEPPLAGHALLRELKKSVRRDLENLLNTRYRCQSAPAHLKELKNSLINYGIPDLASASAGSAKEREDLARALQVIITRHEPRFKNVKVTLLSNAEPLDRTLRFRIDALLLADPAPEPVVFDSMLVPTTHSFVVRGSDHEQ